MVTNNNISGILSRCISGVRPQKCRHFLNYLLHKSLLVIMPLTVALFHSCVCVHACVCWFGNGIIGLRTFPNLLHRQLKHLVTCVSQSNSPGTCANLRTRFCARQAGVSPTLLSSLCTVPDLVIKLLHPARSLAFQISSDAFFPCHLLSPQTYFSHGLPLFLFPLNVPVLNKAPKLVFSWHIQEERLSFSYHFN